MNRVHAVTRPIFQTPRPAEAPNPKPQAPKKSQAPITKGNLETSLFEAWNLELLWNLELAIWDF
jgi:hypothetical protein